MDAPIRMLTPELIAPDTYVIRQLAGEGHGPVATFVNSMVITGAEPVIVDCGPAISREAWLETVFGLVEPEDVRWIPTGPLPTNRARPTRRPRPMRRAHRSRRRLRRLPA